MSRDWGNTQRRLCVGATACLCFYFDDDPDVGMPKACGETVHRAETVRQLCEIVCRESKAEISLIQDRVQSHFATTTLIDLLVPPSCADLYVRVIQTMGETCFRLS